MKIDLAETVKSVKGEEMKQIDMSGKVISDTYPIGDALYAALDFISPQAQPTGDEKLFRGRMMKKIVESDGGELELTAQDASRLQKIVEPYFSVQAYNFVHERLNG